ncbi:MAG: hypothetical protein JO209_09245 [Acidisphaera sp.]|nr:hypothetical protein [Acidisphaera sp.]
MVTTTWLGGSGAWNDPTNWTDGVPGPADDALIPSSSQSETISGGGAAAELTVRTGITLSGDYSVGQYVQSAIQLTLAPAATLAFEAATVSGGGLTIGSGASLGSGAIALSGGLTLSGDLANPLLISGKIAVSGSGTISGPISGSGSLDIGSFYGGGGLLQLTNAANDFSGGVVLNSGTLELSAAGALGSGPLEVDGGPQGCTLLLDAGVSLPPLSVGPGPCTIFADTASLEMFAGAAGLSFINGSGASTVIGALAPGFAFPNFDESPIPSFGFLDVRGGSGSVTVFGGNDGAVIFGGTAGNNVIDAGAAIPGLTPYGPFFNSVYGTTYPPGAATIAGGGNGDLLVATGSLNNLVAAASGNETLTAASATGNNQLFGGSGNDVIAAGAGHDTVVAGTGASTIFGGTGCTAIFAGTGNAEIVDGTGSDYVQMRSGNATIFAGSGPDLFGAVSGQAGGTDLIAGFKNGTDHILLRGYSSAPTAASQNGSTTIALADNTHITLLGVANLAPNTFA